MPLNPIIAKYSGHLFHQAVSCARRSNATLSDTASKRRHGRKIIIGPENANKTKIAPKVEEYGLSALALHLARAHAWMEMLESGKADTIVHLANKLNVDKSYVSRTLGLLDLSPDFQQMVFEGREPEALSLTRLRAGLPEDWEEQGKMFHAQ